LKHKTEYFNRTVTPNDFIRFLNDHGVLRADIISTGLAGIKIVIGHMSKISRSDFDNVLPIGIDLVIERGDCHWLKHRPKNSYRLIYPDADIIREVKYVK